MTDVFGPLNVPVWLSSVCVAATVKARLATMLLVLLRLAAERLISPVVLRVLSALTPASMMPLLVNWPPLLRVMLSRAARLFWLFSAVVVCTSSRVPASTGPWASRLAALTLIAPLAEAWAMRKCPLASSTISPPLAARVPSSFTPTPACVPTSLIAPAYMPPSTDESMANSGFALPSSTRAVMARVWALTSLRPAMTVKLRALICALILAVRVMISKLSTLLAFKP